MVADNRFAKQFSRPRSGSGLGILRSCLALSGAKISSASICIHQPQRSITRHAEEFGTLIREPVATRDGFAQQVKEPACAAISEPGAVATGPKFNVKSRAYLTTLTTTG